MSGLGGQRVLISAGASGIGFASAKAFLAAGARVHVCDVSSDALADCKLAHPQLITTQADIADVAQVDRLFEEVRANWGGLDVLVNNAGISGPTAPVEEVAPEEWERTMAVNINGHFLCTRRAVPLLKEAGGGSIVSISSTAGLFGYPLRTPYVASKWAIIGFTKSLAMELGEYGIRVNAICPGSINNARMDGVINAEAEATDISANEIRTAYENQVSMRTFIDPHEIADMLVFICSDKGRSISGQALSVDGHTETLRTIRPSG